MQKILLLEDDASLIDGLEYSLKKKNFSVDTARSLAEARALLSSVSYTLLLLDVTLPDGNGFDLCEEIRKNGNAVPIIFLTASDEEFHVIRGLDSGGDDYITKPFRLGELFSRIRALLRRSGSKNIPGEDSSVLTSGNISIDLLTSRVTLYGQPLELTSAEYRLLCLLVRNAGLVVTRSMILDELWDGAGHFVDDNTLSVYIRRLREKIEKNPSRPELLTTVRGFGYRWNEVRQ
ncbi:Sensory transduction protein regX3 [Eubacteriaceae bacterium CHKCI004]|nr:Sensory transduction protein regX3 [Eubacteriaceae bacterium CHKCI004]